jgi:spermidine synthase
MDFLTFPIRGEKLSMRAAVSRRVAKERSPYQEIEIVETEVFGRALLLDGHIQLTTFDEHAYHEALVHIPLQAIQNPQRALVIGGGDGGVLRELLRAQIPAIEIVEIDDAVIRLCREHLPSLSQGAFEDPRVNLTVGDAFEYVRTKEAEYDLIVADSTDTYEGEDGALSEALFTETFYQDCRRALRPGGVLVTQADNPVFCPYSLEGVQKAFKDVFAHVEPYFALVPSFGGYSAFAIASDGAHLPETYSGKTPGLRYLNATTYALAKNGLGV